MSMKSMTQSAMSSDAIYAARCFSMSFPPQSPRSASERMSSERAMCTMHMADEAAQSAMYMSMAAAAGSRLTRTDVATSVSLFAPDTRVVSVVLSVVSLLLVSLVVLISLITLLLTCLTGQTTLESLVGQIKRAVTLASINTRCVQGV